MTERIEGSRAMDEHEMVEKVARALARKARVSEMEASGFNGTHLNEYVDAHWQDHADRARAAIAAMEPSIAALVAERDRYKVALDEVARPMFHMRKRAEANGQRLGDMAYVIANSLNHVQEVARAALAQGGET